MALAFAKALQSKYADPSYQVQGPPSSGVIDCGSYSHPDDGCSAEDSDASAAYLQALLFYLTGTPVYATNVVNILNTYGSHLKGYNNSNAPLQSAWGLSKWTRAAELARHVPGINWNADDADAFTRTLQRVSLPLVYNGSPANGNWELSMIEGMMGLAVLAEDASLYDHATVMFMERVAAYFYDFVDDGSAPRPAPRGSPSWYGQTVFDASTSGVAQETCRDEGHTTYGVAATSNAAETAWAQGDAGLWDTFADRLAGAFEFNARLLLPGVKSPADLCGGTPVNVFQYPSYEVAFNALSRRGAGKPTPSPHSMPFTLQHLNVTVRAMPDPVDPHMMVYESLTHGA